MFKSEKHCEKLYEITEKMELHLLNVKIKETVREGHRAI